MADGPGRYNAETSHVLETTGADACVLIVIGGERGDGFEVQARGTRVGPALLASLLRQVAGEIERGAP